MITSGEPCNKGTNGSFTSSAAKKGCASTCCIVCGRCLGFPANALLLQPTTTVTAHHYPHSPVGRLPSRHAATKSTATSRRAIEQSEFSLSTIANCSGVGASNIASSDRASDDLPINCDAPYSQSQSKLTQVVRQAPSAEIIPIPLTSSTG